MSEAIKLLREVRDHLIELHPSSTSAPGHSHYVYGVWDDTEEPCEWCATWSRILEVLDEAATEPSRRAYSREEIVNEARAYVDDQYGQLGADKDRKYQILGVLVDFLHDRFPPAQKESE